jgi:uncharacterized membrane protein
MTFLLKKHMGFYLAAAAAVAAGGVALRFAPMLAVTIAANAFFLTYLAATLAGLPRLTPSYLRRHAASDDIPVSIIFLITLGAVAVAVASLFLTINARSAPDPLLYALSLSAVPLGWLAIHMMAAVHYAHLYWQPDGEDEATGPRARRGLDFPGTKEPGGSDFVYFSYVIGMTAQTSDVAVTTSAMRRINILHAIVSFFFNTVLVAAAVNLAVSLAPSP